MAVYDCFTFYDEFKLAELRMRLLWQFVDYFVIAELPVTHRGKKKKLLFYENREKFQEFDHKIIYVNSCDAPKYKFEGDWSIENWQRNCIMKGLQNCKPDDLILISDADEIPNPELFANYLNRHADFDLKNEFLRKMAFLIGNYNRKEIKKMLHRPRLEELMDFSPVACSQKMFYYYLNCEAQRNWIGTVICKYKNMRMPQGLRNIRAKIPVIQDGGWHFSYFGGIEKIKTKLNSIIDDRQDVIQNMKNYASDDEYILDCMIHGRDLYGREGKQFQFHFIDKDEIGMERLSEIMPDYEKYMFYPDAT